MPLSLPQILALARRQVASVVALLYVAVLLTAGFGHHGLFDGPEDEGRVTTTGLTAPAQLALVAADGELHGCPACQWEAAAISAGPTPPFLFTTPERVVESTVPTRPACVSQLSQRTFARAPPISL